MSLLRHPPPPSASTPCHGDRFIDGPLEPNLRTYEKIGDFKKLGTMLGDDVRMCNFNNHVAIKRPVRTGRSTRANDLDKKSFSTFASAHLDFQ